MRAGDVEGYAIVLGGQRLKIGADLVRHVAIAGDAVGADDAQINKPLLQQMPAIDRLIYLDGGGKEQLRVTRQEVVVGSGFDYSGDARFTARVYPR